MEEDLNANINQTYPNGQNPASYSANIPVEQNFTAPVTPIDPNRYIPPNPNSRANLNNSDEPAFSNPAGNLAQSPINDILGGLTGDEFQTRNLIPTDQKNIKSVGTFFGSKQINSNAQTYFDQSVDQSVTSINISGYNSRHGHFESEKIIYRKFSWDGFGAILNRLSFAIFFLFFGLILLANTSGQLPWEIWLGVLQLWPVLVVLIGVNIVLGVTAFTRVFIPVINLAITIGLVGILIFTTVTKTNSIPFLPKLFFEKSNYSLIVNKDQLGEFTSQNVNLEINAGTAEILENQANSAFQIEGQKYQLGSDSKEPKIDREVKDKILNLNIQTLTNLDFLVKQDQTSPTKIYLSNLPTTLQTTVNVGSLSAKFNNLPISSFKTKINTGVEKISFASPSVPGKFDIEVNSGSFELTLPANLGYNVDYVINGGSVDLEGKVFDGISQKDTFKSVNYDKTNTKTQLTVTVNTGGKFKLLAN
jgi:hypothetical protein